MKSTMAPKKESPTNQRLKKLRERLGLTQTEMGHKLGVTLSTYVRWESGKPIPKTAQLLIEFIEKSDR